MDVRENPGSGNNMVTTPTNSAVKHCNAKKKVYKEMKTNESFQMFYFYLLLKLCNKIIIKKKVRKVTLQNIAEVAQYIHFFPHQEA